MKVVDISRAKAEVNQSIVSALETLLEEARAGKITCLAFATLCPPGPPDEPTFTYGVFGNDPMILTPMAVLQQHCVLCALQGTTIAEDDDK